MATTEVRPGDALYDISARVFNGDVLRFPEILDLNPDVDIFSDLPRGLNLDVPDTAQVLNYAKPALTRVSQAIAGVGRYSQQLQQAITQASGVLPDQLQGYAREALEAIGEVNGVLGEVEQAIGEADQAVRGYEGDLVQLVPWLLGRR